jgi:AcrR family transcriptional regulator
VAAGVDKRSDLVARAVSIFSTKGFRGTSMNDIARAGGLSKSTLYHYFDSKEDLLVEIYENVLRDNVLAAQRIMSSSLSTELKLRQMLIERVVYMCKNRRILQIFFEEEAEIPKRMMTRVYDERKVYVGVMIDLIQQGVVEGVFAIDISPTVVVNTFLGSINWLYKWYEPRGPRTPEELGVDMTDLLLRSITVKPRSAKAAAAAARAASS